MRVSGKISIPEFEIKEIKVPAIQVEFDSTYEVSEIKGMLELAKTVPDAAKEIVEKCQDIVKYFVDREARAACEAEQNNNS